MLSTFTITSPTRFGTLPADVTPVGGIVLDLVGVNGRRVVSQVPAQELFKGQFDTGTPVDYRGNPGTIGIQAGFSTQVLDALGGGLAELAVRLTVFDGDTAAPKDFDLDDNTLLLNGLPVGNFSDVVTERTDKAGQAVESLNPLGGFRDNALDTGFFRATDPAVLDAIFQSLQDGGSVAFQLLDADPYDNVFDFTQGIDGSLIDVGRLPRVENAAPVIATITTNGPLPEGSVARVVVSASDPDGPADPLTYAFDLDGDGIADITGASPVLEFPVTNEGVVTVGVRVIDSIGAEAAGTAVVNIVNVAPSVTPSPSRDHRRGDRDHLRPRHDGRPRPRSGLDDHRQLGRRLARETFTVHQTGPLGVLGHTYAQDGAYQVGLTVDDGTDIGSSTFAVNVVNVAPTLTAPSSQTTDEGTPTSFDLGSFTDPGALDRWTVTVDWGDGSPVETFHVTHAGPLGTLDHNYAQDGAYQVGLTVEDGADTGSSTFAVNVDNVAPILTAPTAQDTDEGTATPFDLGTLADPGLEAGWTITVNWGDDTPDETFTVYQTGGLGSLGHTYAQDGRYRVTTTARDGQDQGASGFEVTVGNLPPSIDSATMPTSVARGDPATLDLRVSDPGVRDALLVTVDWGDGTTTTVPLAAGTTATTLTRPFDVAIGGQTITITLEDDAGARVQTTIGLDVLAQDSPLPIQGDIEPFVAPPPVPPNPSTPFGASSGPPTTIGLTSGSSGTPPATNQSLRGEAPLPAPPSSPGTPDDDDPSPENAGPPAPPPPPGDGAAVAAENQAAGGTAGPEVVLLAQSPDNAPPVVASDAASNDAGPPAPPPPGPTDTATDDDRHGSGAVLTTILVVAVVRQRQPRSRGRRMNKFRRHVGGVGR